MTPRDYIHPPEAACEAFAARYARLLITAAEDYWLDAAIGAVGGYGTSLIGCDCEIGVERRLTADEAPDGRPGVALLAFHFGAEKLGRAVANRVGQGLLTCPTAAVFDGLPGESDRAPLGDYLRFFGDGHEQPAEGGWTIPIMEGEVSMPATLGVGHGVAGGNLLVCGRDQAETLAAARRAAEALRDLPGVITPFPGGVCRSGSKVGSRYKKLVASTNEAYCPRLRDSTTSKLPDGAECVYELIINGVDEPAVRKAMRIALQAAIAGGAFAVTAAEYGGSLGDIRIPLHELIDNA